MTDDRKRRRFMSDDERAIGRMKTRPRGVPIHVPEDEDLTPAPQPIPIVGDVNQRIDLLARAVEQLTDATGKVWNERGNGERIERLEKAMESIGQSVTAWVQEAVRHNEQIKGLHTNVGAVVNFTESLRTTTASTSSLLTRFFDREWPQHQQLMERFEKALDNVADRLTRLEAAVERLHSNDAALAARLTANEAVVGSLDVRLTAAERTLREQALVKTTELATHRKWFSWARAGFVAVGGAVVFLVSHVGDFVAWIKK